MQLTQLLLIAGAFACADAIPLWNNRDILYAKQFVNLAGAAYCSKENIQAWDCKFCKYVQVIPGTVTVIENKTLELQVYVAEVMISRAPGAEPERTIVISFRGSSNIPNWIADFVFDKDKIIPALDVEIHKGFHWCYNEVKYDLRKAVTQLCAQQRKRDNIPEGTACQIAVTGHSLGAALSIVATSDIQGLWTGVWAGENVNVTQLVNFGAPRVGNDHFSAYFSDVFPGHQIRMVHHADLVPHLPPVEFNYRHTLQEIWELKDAAQYEVCSDTNPEDLHCSDSVPLIEWNPNDHTVYMQTDLSC